MSKDLGDFQTPPALVKDVINCLAATGKRWTRALEPTCGQGNFISGLLEASLSFEEIQGIEIQDQYVKQASSIVISEKSTAVSIRQANIFALDLRSDVAWTTRGPLLVIGNPPWITNSALSALQSDNVPSKSNFKKLPGFEAMTGSSNFDIAEYIILKLLYELASEQPTLAMLCKTLVARNILKFASEVNLPISGASIRKFDSKKYFAASVDACLFCLDVGLENHLYQVDVYQDLYTIRPTSTIGLINGQLVSNLHANKTLAFIEGTCPLNWRQGVKHDAAPVIELVYDGFGQLRNKLGEVVVVEPASVYPLLKSSDLGGKEKERPRRAVIVTQKRVGEKTQHLEDDAPDLWRYLSAHSNVFDQRKSSIYTNQPPFSMFGIGDYSFALYKVAISGLYKSLKFVAIGPVNDRPVIFDDTCYFIACESAQQAAFLTSLLNDPVCLDFIRSIIFWDAKRPITKKSLQRIDLYALLEHIDKDLLLMQATIELKRIEVMQNACEIIWPEDLRELLRSSSINAVGLTPERKRLVAKDVIQMNLLEI